MIFLLLTLLWRPLCIQGSDNRDTRLQIFWDDFGPNVCDEKPIFENGAITFGKNQKKIVIYVRFVGKIANEMNVQDGPIFPTLALWHSRLDNYNLVEMTIPERCSGSDLIYTKITFEKDKKSANFPFQDQSISDQVFCNLTLCHIPIVEISERHTFSYSMVQVHMITFTSPFYWIIDLETIPPLNPNVRYGRHVKDRKEFDVPIDKIFFRQHTCLYHSAFIAFLSGGKIFLIATLMDVDRSDFRATRVWQVDASSSFCRAALGKSFKGKSCEGKLDLTEFAVSSTFIAFQTDKGLIASENFVCSMRKSRDGGTVDVEYHNILPTNGHFYHQFTCSLGTSPDSYRGSNNVGGIVTSNFLPERKEYYYPLSVQIIVVCGSTKNIDTCHVWLGHQMNNSKTCIEPNWTVKKTISQGFRTLRDTFFGTKKQNRQILSGLKELSFVFLNFVMNDVIFLYQKSNGKYCLVVHRVIPDLGKLKYSDDTVEGVVALRLRSRPEFAPVLFDFVEGEKLAFVGANQKSGSIYVLTNFRLWESIDAGNFFSLKRLEPFNENYRIGAFNFQPWQSGYLIIALDIIKRNKSILYSAKNIDPIQMVGELHLTGNETYTAYLIPLPLINPKSVERVGGFITFKKAPGLLKIKLKEWYKIFDFRSRCASNAKNCGGVKAEKKSRILVERLTRRRVLLHEFIEGAFPSSSSLLEKNNIIFISSGHNSSGNESSGIKSSGNESSGNRSDLNPTKPLGEFFIEATFNYSDCSLLVTKCNSLKSLISSIDIKHLNSLVKRLRLKTQKSSSGFFAYARAIALAPSRWPVNFKKANCTLTLSTNGNNTSYAIAPDPNAVPPANCSDLKPFWNLVLLTRSNALSFLVLPGQKLVRPTEKPFEKYKEVLNKLNGVNFTSERWFASEELTIDIKPPQPNVSKTEMPPPAIMYFECGVKRIVLYKKSITADLGDTMRFILKSQKQMLIPKSQLAAALESQPVFYLNIFNKFNGARITTLPKLGRFFEEDVTFNITQNRYAKGIVAGYSVFPLLPMQCQEGHNSFIVRHGCLTNLKLECENRVVSLPEFSTPFATLPENYRPPSDEGRAIPRTTNIYNAKPPKKSKAIQFHRPNYGHSAKSSFKVASTQCPLCRGCKNYTSRKKCFELGGDCYGLTKGFLEEQSDCIQQVSTIVLEQTSNEDWKPFQLKCSTIREKMMDMSRLGLLEDDIDSFGQNDHQLLFFYEVNNRTNFEFVSQLTETYRNFLVEQNSVFGIDFDSVKIRVKGSGLYHWKFQSIGFSFCGFLLGQNIGLVDVNAVMYPMNKLVICLTTVLMGCMMLSVYLYLYAERPQVRQRITGPHCEHEDFLPYKTLKEKEKETQWRQEVQATRNVNVFETSDTEGVNRKAVPQPPTMAGMGFGNRTDARPGHFRERDSSSSSGLYKRRRYISAEQDSSGQGALTLQSSLIGLKGKVVSGKRARKKGLKTFKKKQEDK